jgi:hypothetical protein
MGVAMVLPGRLRMTTFGALLDTLHRSVASGTLELATDQGRRHRVHFVRGMVAAVELDGATASLADVLRRIDAVDDETLRRSFLRALASRRLHGEVLVRDFHLAPHVVDAALREQLLVRLEALLRLPDAQILFRVAVRPPRGALIDDPIPHTELFRSRSAARERRARSDAPTADPPPVAQHLRDPDTEARHTLGVPPGADPTEIKRAYRRLARDTHPDLHPLASDDERRALAERFVRITAAYQALVA